MIRTLLLFLFVLCFINLNAQERVGVFTTYGLRNKLVGIGINGQFFFGEKLGITPEFNYNFPRKTIYNSGTSIVIREYKTWSLACDLNHFFIKKNNFEFYGLIGVNILSETEENTYDNNPTSITKYTEIGLDLGLGTNFNTSGKFVPYFQVKYEGNSFQLVLHAGVRYSLK
jgi:hypothetical protein